MDYDSKDLMVVELEPETDANGFVEETANSALASGVSFEADDQAIHQAEMSLFGVVGGHDSPSGRKAALADLVNGRTHGYWRA